VSVYGVPCGWTELCESGNLLFYGVYGGLWVLHYDVPHPKLTFGELLHRRNSRNLQVRAQEVDLVGEYTLTHRVTIEVEVGDRVATQLPARRPLG
jgi:hypothetical protein